MSAARVFRLDLTLAQLLAHIGVSARDAEAPPLDPSDPAFLARETVRFVVRTRVRGELVARVEPPLRQRFCRLASWHLEEDLLRPMHKAAGNCDRRGNRGDPDKWLTAEVYVTSRGAVLAVSDQGSGFDVGDVVRRFENGERYFTRRGQGIAQFARTNSLVSYADGGRTWLLRFLSDPEPGQPLPQDESATWGTAGDAERMRGLLADLPLFGDRRGAVESCRVFRISSAPGPRELAYVLRCGSGDVPPEAIVVTGRLLDAAAVRTDVAVAGQLRADEAVVAGGLHIPEPLGAFAEPPVSLFRLDPTETLRAHVQQITEPGPLGEVVRTIATGLAALHRSAVRTAATEPLAEVLAWHRATQQRLCPRLPDARDRERAAACFDRLLAHAGRLEPCEPALVHGALEWDCIVRAAGPWAVYRFDRCRLAHPGRDAGVFLADLLRFHVLRRDGIEALWPAGRAAFVDAYFGGRPPPWSKDLDWFVAAALLERLDRMTRRPEEKWTSKVARLLDEIERTLPS